MEVEHTHCIRPTPNWIFRNQNLSESEQVMLELKNISLRTPESDADAQSPAGRIIIHDLSFTFESGEFYAIT